MHDTITTLTLVVLTVIAAGASLQAARNLIGGSTSPSRRRVIVSLVGICALGSLLLFAYRVVLVHHGFAPLTAHVDGLLLIAAMLAPTIAYLHSRSRVPNIAAFALPLLTLIFAWAICASAWTLRLFSIHTVWDVLHLASVYLGAVFFGIAGVAGVMFLYAQHRLRRKIDLANPQRVASLEAIEKLIVNVSVLGFALLTLGILTAVVIRIAEPERVHEGLWYWSKILLSAVVWLMFALVINVRHSTHFRGTRAAWLAIVGACLVIVTFAVANLPEKEGDGASSERAQPGRVEPRNTAGLKETR